MTLSKYLSLGLFLIAGLVVSQVTYAALYKWVDENGVTRYTTTPPPESAKFDREVIGKDGRTLDTIRGKMTAEEKAAEEARLAAEEQAKKDKAEAEKHDRILMISYSSVEDIVAKRDQKMAQYRDQVAGLEADFEQAQSEFQQLSQQAIAEERAGKMPSQELQGNLRSARREHDDFTFRLKESKDGLLQAEKQFAADVERFKELKGIQ